MPDLPDLIPIWIPRGDEHQLAASLDLCERDPAVLQQLADAARERLARDCPGTRVRVYRWHVWRVVRALGKLGLTNDQAGRASAYAYLATENDDEEER